ncbi:bifunctional DNA primase/polymerase [Streptomyces alfalfae]|uniref:bifunctional DNA primase/polymerase n=1 Tax=Streptomyces alfalfae TaxID=1642299 RepID=UPI002811F5A8|nr:bifunctional DNA primase/polymerase [Streptomyces alfalfae]
MSERTKLTIPHGTDAPGGNAEVGITKCRRLWVEHSDTIHLADLDVERIRRSENPDDEAPLVLQEALTELGLNSHSSLNDWCFRAGADVLNTVLGTADYATRFWVYKDHNWGPTKVPSPGAASNSLNPFDSFTTFPLKPGTKIPAVRWREHTGGHKPGFNHGVDCGRSGVTVVDLDEREDGSGIDAFNDLAKKCGATIPDTLTVRTPTGGRHLYFAAPKDTVIGNSAGRLAHHVDVRGQGGYVVGPGSKTDVGTYEIELDVPIAPFPAWIVELLTSPQLPSKSTLEQRPAASSGHASDKRHVSTHEKFLGCLSRVLGAAEGTRNDTLNREVFRAIKLGIAPDIVAEIMFTAGIEIGLPEDEVEDVIGRAIASALLSGQRSGHAG